MNDTYRQPSLSHLGYVVSSVGVERSKVVETIPTDADGQLFASSVPGCSKIAKPCECNRALIRRKLHSGFSLAVARDSIYKVYTFFGDGMSKHKSHGKEKKKSSQLVIRVEKTERDAFVSLCDRLDTSAAREIRRFMREQVAVHSGKDASAGGTDTSVISEAATDEPATAGVVPAEVPDQTADAPEEAAAEKAVQPKKKKRKRAVH